MVLSPMVRVQGALTDNHRNRWFVEVEEKQDARVDEATGEPFFQYTNGDPIPLDWCLVMRLDRKNKPDELPDEVKEVVERLVSADLFVRHHISIRQDEIYIQIGATLTQMLHEATHHMVIQMPVRGHHPARGCIPFHYELQSVFQTEEEYLRGKEFRFHSGLRQRIVMNLIQRVAHINPAEKVLAPNRIKLLKSCKDKVARGKGMQRWALKELLEANLCTTMTSNEEKTRARLPQCMEIYKQILELEELEIKTQGSSNSGERVSIDHCQQVIAEIDASDLNRTDLNSGFICEMVDFYPLHDAKELQHLMKVWADLSNMWRWKMPFALDEGTHIVNSWAMFYQPTSKVRDYFGDHVALYFAWLQLYTCWLRYAALVGAFVMIGNYYGDNGIDGNPFVLAYSIFLSLWSTMFVEAWVNRENELRCLWGSAGFEAQEQPRPQFRGVIREDPMTKVKELVHESDLVRYAKTAASQTIILFCIMLVIFGAYGAYAIRQIKKVTDESCINPCHQLQQRWEATAQQDDWTDFDFVVAKQAECEAIFSERDRPDSLANSTWDHSTSFCTFSRPLPGAENGACIEATWWLNGTLCRGDKLRFKYEEKTMPKGSREYQYRFGADISHQSTEISRRNCEEATGVRGDCIYTPYLLDGLEINPTWWERTKWKLLSSLINLVLIQGGGQVYERLAGFLNEWENHRTETEYTDSLIFKAFGFQFVNNYFTLFYIAFLIHFKIFPGMQTGCDGHTSCMGELQWQLFIVFTGKTMMKKVVEVSKPFVKSCIKGFGAKKVARTNQVVDATMKVKDVTGNLVTGSPTALIGATKEVALKTASQATQLAAETANRTVLLANETATKATAVVGDYLPGQSPRAASAADLMTIDEMEDGDMDAIADAGLFAEPCERERWLDRYGDRRFPGTFYDFKDMAIQFGVFLACRCRRHHRSSPSLINVLAAAVNQVMSLCLPLRSH